MTPSDRRDKLFDGLSLTLGDLKKIEDCVTYKEGGIDLFNAPARAFDCCLNTLGYTDKEGLATLQAIKGIPTGVRNGIYNFVKDKAIDAIGKKTIGNMFPNEDKVPESFEDTVEDSGKWLAEIIKEEIKNLTDK